MRNLIVTDYLNYYRSLTNPQYAVLLKGPWGCGKTFFIKQLVETWTESETKKSHKNTIQPIYVSLNGICKIETINEKIKEKINPFLYSKGAKIAKELVFGAIKTATKINLDIDGDKKEESSISFDLNPINLLTNNKAKIKGNKILIFDDLERCKIPTDEIFGYINIVV